MRTIKPSGTEEEQAPDKKSLQKNTKVPHTHIRRSPHTTTAAEDTTMSPHTSCCTWLNIMAATLYMDFNVLRWVGPSVALRSSKHSSNSGSARWYAPAVMCTKRARRHCEFTSTVESWSNGTECILAAMHKKHATRIADSSQIKGGNKSRYTAVNVTHLALRTSWPACRWSESYRLAAGRVCAFGAPGTPPAAARRQYVAAGRGRTRPGAAGCPSIRGG
jgi:hypothetical protein